MCVCVCSSHAAAPFVKLVALDDGIDVFAGSGEIDISEERLCRHSGGAISAAPSLRATGAGIVFGKSEGHWIRLRFPVFERAMQIPVACLEICFRNEKLIHGKLSILFHAPIHWPLFRSLA